MSIACAVSHLQSDWSKSSLHWCFLTVATATKTVHFPPPTLTRCTLLLIASSILHVYLQRTTSILCTLEKPETYLKWKLYHEMYITGGSVGSRRDPQWRVTWVQIPSSPLSCFKHTQPKCFSTGRLRQAMCLLAFSYWTVLDCSSQRTCPLVQVGRLDSTGWRRGRRVRVKSQRSYARE